MANRDYYEVLGISRDASADDIKRAFRRLAAKHHPDANPGNPHAEEQFKEINAAYQVLSDPQKRAQYDQFGHRGAEGEAGADFGFGGFGDIFDMFFGGNTGGASRRTGPERGPDLRYDLTVTLDEVLHGAEKEVRVAREETCAHCHGNQAEPGTRIETCSQCRGVGQVERVTQSFLGNIRRIETCPRCHGAGKTVQTPCRVCSGRGQVRAEKKLMVHMPPGVDDNTRLRVAGEGGAGRRGGPPGDLIVFAHVAKHDHFERDGDDLWTVASVGFAQATLGADVEVQGLEGPERIHIPAGTQPGTVLRVARAGLPRIGHPSNRGSLNIRVQIAVPTQLSAREREVLRTWAEMRQEPVVAEDKGIFRKVKDALGR
ncbi:MAG: molecular chaperone DnaJ [Thermaerobacter sp.]|nr:molecular chaperone DnaJ [Thermaerobacter sp.]